MKGMTLTAVRLRLLLVISLFAVLGIGIAAFIFGTGQLQTTAADVGKSIAQSTESSNNLATLQLLQKQLDANKETVARANKLVAHSEDYSYQNQLISDVTVYANRARINVSNISFTTQGTTAAPAAPGAAAAPAAKSGVAGLKPATITLTIKNPVDYKNLLQFMQMIEQNLTKMQLAGISVSRNDTQGIASETLSIDVYIR